MRLLVLLRYKNTIEIQIGSKLKRLRMDKTGEYYDPLNFQSRGIIHESTAGYAHNQMVWQRGKSVIYKTW